MRRSRTFRALGAMLALAVWLPLCCAQPVMGTAAPTMRDMAACCQNMAKNCPAMGQHSRDCCQMRMTALRPVALLTAAAAPTPPTTATVLASVPALAAPPVPHRLAPAASSPPPLDPALRRTSVLLI